MAVPQTVSVLNSTRLRRPPLARNAPDTAPDLVKQRRLVPPASLGRRWWDLGFRYPRFEGDNSVALTGPRQGRTERHELRSPTSSGCCGKPASSSLSLHVIPARAVGKCYAAIARKTLGRRRIKGGPRDHLRRPSADPPRTAAVRQCQNQPTCDLGHAEPDIPPLRDGSGRLREPIAVSVHALGSRVTHS